CGSGRNESSPGLTAAAGAPYALARAAAGSAFPMLCGPGGLARAAGAAPHTSGTTAGRTPSCGAAPARQPPAPPPRAAGEARCPERAGPPPGSAGAGLAKRVHGGGARLRGHSRRPWVVGVSDHDRPWREDLCLVGRIGLERAVPVQMVRRDVEHDRGEWLDG